MPNLVALRFYGDDVLASCLQGHHIFAGGGDPPDTISVIQQALADRGYAVAVDGVFGNQKGSSVSAYQAFKGLLGFPISIHPIY